MQRHPWKQWTCLLAILAVAAWAPRAVATTGCANYEPKDVDTSLLDNSCIVVTQHPEIPSPHVESCSTTINNQIWVVSGSTNSDSNTGQDQPTTTRTDIYSPESDTWAAGPDVNIAREMYPNVFNVAGTLFLVGGMSQTAPDSGVFAPCHPVEVCRPDGTGYTGLGIAVAAGDKAWHVLPAANDMPAGTASYFCRSNAVVGSSLYLFTPGQTLRFDTATGIWSTGLATHAGANSICSCAITYNNAIYVSGGDGGSSPTDPEASLFGRYDPLGDSWTDLARYPDPGLAEHGMEVVGGNTILTVGGDFKGNALYYYDPASNTLVSRVSSPPASDTRLYSRSDHVSGVYNGSVYILGGIEAGTSNAQPASLAIGLPY